jgi:hypothetical protein
LCAQQDRDLSNTKIEGERLVDLAEELITSNPFSGLADWLLSLIEEGRQS